jgi:hypothetical protein
MSNLPNQPDSKKAHFFVRTLRPTDGLDGIPDFMAAIVKSSSYDIARFIATFSHHASGDVHVKIQETYSTYAPHSEDWEATAPEILLTGKDARENETLFKDKLKRVYGSDCEIGYVLHSETKASH